MRTAARLRLNTSRPTSSVPNQCLVEGPRNRLVRSCCSGLWVAIHGANTPATTMRPTIVHPTIIFLDTARRAVNCPPGSRIHGGQRDVAQQVDDHDDEGKHQSETLDHVEVAIDGALHHRLAKTRQAERRLDEHRAEQEVGDRRGQKREGGHDGVAQHEVAGEGPTLDSRGSRRDHVVRLQHVEHRCAQASHQDRRECKPQRDAREHHRVRLFDEPGGPSPDWKPPGAHCDKRQQHRSDPERGNGESEDAHPAHHSVRPLINPTRREQCHRHSHDRGNQGSTDDEPQGHGGVVGDQAATATFPLAVRPSSPWATLLT